MPLGRFFTLIFILLLATRVGWADEILEEGISVKALGMGNAYLTHAKGHDSIFYNPAGLASMTGLQWRVTGLNLGLNGLDVYDEYADIFDNSNDLPATLNQLYGRPIWTRLDLQTSFSIGSFIFGGFARANAGFILLNPALPNLQTAYFADYGLFGGWGVAVIPEVLETGFIVKRLTRYAGDVAIGASTLAYLDSDVLEDSVQRKGTGYGLDVGANLKFPGAWHPVMSFAWKDVGDTTFTIDADTPPPRSIKDQMSVGIGFERDFTLLKIKPELNYKYIGTPIDDMQIGKRLHAGLELKFPGFALRGGLNQGYYTAGASFDLWFFQLDLATYGLELGEYVGQQEDRRYILQLTMDFGVEPSTGQWFNFSKTRQSARRGTLKERR